MPYEIDKFIQQIFSSSSPYVQVDPVTNNLILASPTGTTLISGTLSFMQGFKPPIRMVTGSTTIIPSDYAIVCGGSTNYNIQLPLAAQCQNQQFNLKVLNANAITVLPSGSDTIDGGSNYMLSKFTIIGILGAPQVSVTLQVSGSTWYVF